MIFVKQYLITLKFIVILVWVRLAATEPDFEKLIGKNKCIDLQ